jgi:hypothetical protein
MLAIFIIPTVVSHCMLNIIALQNEDILSEQAVDGGDPGTQEGKWRDELHLRDLLTEN